MNAHPQNKTRLGAVIKMVIPLALLALGGAAWAYFQTTAPKIKRTPPKRQATPVSVVAVSAIDTRSMIKAMGTVTASREITLKARVSGEILALSPHFTPGGHLAQGDLILKLDASDYQVEVQKAESALAKARANLAIEQGSQTIAREELRLLAETSTDTIAETDLALRKPQLQQAQAAVSSAEADLRRARLDLARTEVRAPFNALVIDQNVNLGSHVNSQDALATLVSTDEYWVAAAVPLDRLSALALNPENGSMATIRSQSGYGQWQGRVLRATGRLNEKSRMAKVIIAIPDPMGIHSDSDRPQLMLDDYVSVEIQGRELPSVIALPRGALHDDNTVWIFRDGRLHIEKVTLAWKQTDRVLVRSGLAVGDQVIVSDLATPVEGMQLKILNARKPAAADAAADA